MTQDHILNISYIYSLLLRLLIVPLLHSMARVLIILIAVVTFLFCLSEYHKERSEKGKSRSEHCNSKANFPSTAPPAYDFKQ
jgi:hypothetical protein